MRRVKNPDSKSEQSQKSSSNSNHVVKKRRFDIEKWDKEENEGAQFPENQLMSVGEDYSYRDEEFYDLNGSSSNVISNS